MITDTQIKALTILREHGPLAPREFAEKMWPDSPGWDRVYNCGPYGATRGLAMWRSGGAYLGKLAQQGLVEPDLRHRWLGGLSWMLSEKGTKALGVAPALVDKRE